jgi:serine/threonine-protein kinase
MVQSVSATVGKYTLAERLDRGGPGEVYLARHWRQQVLIRLLTDLPSDTPDFARRFETQVERLADLDHPQIVPIIGFGQQDGVPYLVMPPVVGERLTDRFARNRPRADELADYLRPIAEALDYAHARGVAHGDLRATNVLLDSNGALFLADFGVARIDDDSIGVHALTRGDDIAALARIAYLGLTGQALAAGSSISWVMPGATVLDRALAGSTVDGYDSAGAFVRDLAVELANPGGGDGETDSEVAPGPARHAPAMPRRAQAFLP